MKPIIKTLILGNPGSGEIILHPGRRPEGAHFHFSCAQPNPSVYKINGPQFSAGLGSIQMVRVVRRLPKQAVLVLQKVWGPVELRAWDCRVPMEGHVPHPNPQDLWQKLSSGCCSQLVGRQCAVTVTSIVRGKSVFIRGGLKHSRNCLECSFQKQLETRRFQKGTRSAKDLHVLKSLTNDERRREITRPKAATTRWPVCSRTPHALFPLVTR